MTFLAPHFLFGLLALPIPFIIHLWHRRRLKIIWFPSILLLKRAEEGQKAFRRLKDIILLVLRTLSLLFLVLAFANPCLLRKLKIAVLDDSWDMHTKIGESSIFEKGKEMARSLKNTKVILASGEPFSSSCKYQKFHLPSGVDYIITKKDKLPDTLKTKLIEIEGEAINFSIDSISIGHLSFSAFITNWSQEKRTRLISLTDGTKFFETYISIPPYSTRIAFFPPFSEACAGSVRIEEEDALWVDNVRYFVHSPLPILKVLIIGKLKEAFFIKNALSPPYRESTINVDMSPRIKNPSLYDVIISVGGEALKSEKTIYFPVKSTKVDGILTMNKISTLHPIFNGLEYIDELKQINFTYRERIKEKVKTISSFSDGTPAIFEYQEGGIGFSFPCDQRSKEFILSPLFPVLMHRIVYWVAGKPIEKHNFIVGEKVKLKVQEFKNYLCIRGKDKKWITPTVEPTGIYIYFTPQKPGIYEIPGVSKFAVNISNSVVYPELSLDPIVSQLSIKKWFFFLVLLLLTAELIIRRTK